MPDLERERHILLGQLVTEMAEGCSSHIEGLGLYTACLVFGFVEDEKHMYVALAGSDVPKELLIEVMELALLQLQTPREMGDA